MSRLRTGERQAAFGKVLPTRDDAPGMPDSAVAIAERIIRRIVDQSVPRWAEGSLVAGFTFSERAEESLAVHMDGRPRRALMGGSFADFGFQSCKIYMAGPALLDEGFTAIKRLTWADAKVWGIPFIPGAMLRTATIEDGIGVAQSVTIRRNGRVLCVAVRIHGEAKLRYSPPYPEWESQNDEECFAAVRLALRYSWRVRISRLDAPALEFQCDSAGVRAAFRLRELPAGKDRRESLLHWVCSHQRRDGDGDAVDVAEHLRGARGFTWGDLRFAIQPSEFDREKELTRKDAGRKRGSP